MVIIFLSNRYVRAVVGTAGKKVLKVKEVYSMKDESHCILNGMVMDEEEFLRQIQQFWIENHLPKKGVRLVVGGSEFTTKITEIPIQKSDRMVEFVSREFADVGRIQDPVYGYFPMPPILQVSTLPAAQTAAQKENPATAPEMQKKQLPGLKKGKKQKLQQKDKKALKEQKKREQEEKKRKSSMQKVFAMETSREYLENYKRLFQKIGVHLECVEPVMGTMLRFNQILNCLKYDASIVQYVDDISINNALVINGEQVYSNRTRLYSDLGTVEYPVEAARAVSNILQFAKAQNIPQEITDVYVSGLEEEDYQIYSDSIMQLNSRLNAKKLSIGSEVVFSKNSMGDRNVPGMDLAIGALCQADKRTNVYRQLSRNYEKEAEVRKAKKKMIPLVLTAVVLGTAAGGLELRHLGLKMELQEILDYNQNPAVIKACTEHDTEKEKIEVLSTLKTAVNELEKRVLQYPAVNSEINANVQGCAKGLAEVEITGYNSENGSLSFTASAQDVEQIHRFAALLTQQSFFSNVNYTGYTQHSDNSWSVNVSCTMAARWENSDDTDNNGEG